MALLKWMPCAWSEYENICRYLEQHSEQASRKFATDILRLAEDAAEFPYHGPMVPEYEQQNIRERLYGKYRVVYRIRDDGIEILMIWHSARLLPSPLLGDI
ncbi:MAG: type II toxin-antitoxin system RelE/ParE family toxin [Bacteroidales bacterium]|nr:type II toxin-antitoxin system RelE/ParE family toxin [Bacteroidales bacterium]